MLIPRIADTRPFRGRGVAAYAGCMTVERTAAIDSVHSSASSHRYGLWVGREIIAFTGILAPLVAGSRPWPGKHPKPRVPRVPDRALGLLVGVDQECQNGTLLAPLVASLMRRTASPRRRVRLV